MRIVLGCCSPSCKKILINFFGGLVRKTQLDFVTKKFKCLKIRFPVKSPIPLLWLGEDGLPCTGAHGKNATRFTGQSRGRKGPKWTVGGLSKWLILDGGAAHLNHKTFGSDGTQKEKIDLPLTRRHLWGTWGHLEDKLHLEGTVCEVPW